MFERNQAISDCGSARFGKHVLLRFYFRNCWDHCSSVGSWKLLFLFAHLGSWKVVRLNSVFESIAETFFLNIIMSEGHVKFFS